MKTKIEPLVNREGFWASDYETHLPNPVATSWKGRTTFLRLLEKAESKATTIAYKGSSTCRICDIRNGSEEFKLKFQGSTWVWPEGFVHYINEHQVRPSLAFEEFIIKATSNTL